MKLEMKNLPTVHLICNAHLDPVWQWQWEEGCSEALSTFYQAVQLLKEDQNLIFNHNEALLYQWILEYNPELFAEIQALVKRGRWFISGGWFLQPDLNLPGLESLIRNIALGRQFFSKYFGVNPKVALNYDSFGHCGGLPQILTQAGYKMYIHMRPQAQDLELPADLYRWQGVDGAEIIGYRIENGLYHTEYDNLKERLTQAVDLALTLERDTAVFWGIGNHGGGATRADLKIITEFARQEQRVQIRHSNTDTLYQALQADAQSAPLVKGDLQRVFTGCYTSLAKLKRRALSSLSQLIQTETLCALNWWKYGQRYPGEELSRTWRDQVFNDFHDILPGTCIAPAEQDALDLYGKSIEQSRRLRLGVAIELNRGCPNNAYLPVTVLNSNPCLSQAPVEVEFMISHRPKWSGHWEIKLCDHLGHEVPCQEEQPEALLPFNGWRRKVSFMAKFTGAGAFHYYAQPVERKSVIRQAAPRLRYALGPQSKTDPFFEPVVLDDPFDSWGATCHGYTASEESFHIDKESLQTIAWGPHRKIDQMVMTYKRSKIVYNLVAYAAWPVLELNLRIYWNEPRKMLKLKIPTDPGEKNLHCEIPGGLINRSANAEEQVCGQWLQSNKLGIVNSGQHGFDFSEDQIRLSLLRSAAYCHEQGFQIKAHPARKFMDQGVHDLRLLITYGSQAEVAAFLPLLADWLTAPPAVYSHLPVGAEPRLLLPTIRIPGVRLLACLPSPDNKALIIRLQEITGETIRAELWQAPVQFKPFEIKTIRREKSGLWREVSLF
jgi:alpha-mannosidase